MCNPNVKVGHIWFTEFMEKENKNKNPSKLCASETNPRQCLGRAVGEKKVLAVNVPKIGSLPFSSITSVVIWVQDAIVRPEQKDLVSKPPFLFIHLKISSYFPKRAEHLLLLNKIQTAAKFPDHELQQLICNKPQGRQK